MLNERQMPKQPFLCVIFLDAVRLIYLEEPLLADDYFCYSQMGDVREIIKYYLMSGNKRVSVRVCHLFKFMTSGAVKYCRISKYTHVRRKFNSRESCAMNSRNRFSIV